MYEASTPKYTLVTWGKDLDPNWMSPDEAYELMSSELITELTGTTDNMFEWSPNYGWSGNTSNRLIDTLESNVPEGGRRNMRNVLDILEDITGKSYQLIEFDRDYVLYVPNYVYNKIDPDFVRDFLRDNCKWCMYLYGDVMDGETFDAALTRSDPVSKVDDTRLPFLANVTAGNWTPKDASRIAAKSLGCSASDIVIRDWRELH